MDLSHRPTASAWECRRLTGRRWLEACVAAAVVLFLAGQVVPALAKEGTGATPVLAVRVTLEKKPVQGASVVAIDGENHIRALTNRDGDAQLRLSADGTFNGVVALDPQRGLGGRWSRSRRIATPPGEVVPISLEPARPHTFRVVDTEGKPARLVPLVVSAYRTWTSGWVPTGAFEAAHLHTDARGEAVARWLPRDLMQVEVDIFDDRWTIERVDSAQADRGITLVKVRRLRAVEGRLTMSSDASPEGLLIAGLGSITTSQVHETSARVRRDGTFTLYVANGYGYWLSVIDSQWASDPWIGTIGEPANQPPGPINLTAYSAPTLTVRVTRGLKHEPVAGASLEVAGGEDSMLWDQARRQTRLGLGGVLGRFYTDRDGRAQIAVCKGTHTIWLEAGDWQEDQTVEIAGDKPTSVEFHRPWAVKRTIPGRLLVHGRPHPGGTGTRVRAWNVSNPEVAADGVVDPNGRFTVKIDAPDVYVLAFDSQNRLSAAGRVGVKDATANLELIPTAPLSGVVVDSAGKPLAGHAVEALRTQGPLSVDVEVGVDQNGNALPVNMGKMVIEGGADLQMARVVLQSAVCDAQGRFKVDLPAQMRMRVVAGTPADARGGQFSLWPARFRVDATQDVYLEPGEARDVRLVAAAEVSPKSAPEQETPHDQLEQGLKRAREDAAREGLRLLVLLIGESTKGGADVGDNLFAQDALPALSRYELACLNADEVRSQAAYLSRLGWERPQAGEVVLIVVDASGAKIAAHRFKADGTAAPGRRAAEFIKRHATAPRDALALLTAAQREARTSGRRLWVVETGYGFESPRGGDLARWMDDQRALLAKDYVVLRIGAYYDHCEESLAKFQPQGKPNPDRDAATPWFAIAEPDGKVLVTSIGPLGNIGLPSTIEEKRHLKGMITRTARHLTPAECDRLIESLPKAAP
jgi:hypothetical protein